MRDNYEDPPDPDLEAVTLELDRGSGEAQEYVEDCPVCCRPWQVHVDYDATGAAARWRVAIVLTGAMVTVYFGFILVIAYARPVLARRIVPGLSLGILLGALVIVASWILSWVYVRWANTRYDGELRPLRE